MLSSSYFEPPPVSPPDEILSPTHAKAAGYAETPVVGRLWRWWLPTLATIGVAKILPK